MVNIDWGKMLAGMMRTAMGRDRENVFSGREN